MVKANIHSYGSSNKQQIVVVEFKVDFVIKVITGEDNKIIPLGFEQCCWVAKTVWGINESAKPAYPLCLISVLIQKHIEQCKKDKLER